MGMLTRGTAADVVVLALVGERGREVRGFIEHDLGPGGHAALGRRRLDVRQPAAAAAARRLHRHLGRRVLPRSGAERAAADGFGHALRDGAARGRPGGRRAADDQGLSAVGVRAAADAARAGRRRARPRQHHRDVHRARRRRRPQRAGRRRGALDSRRPLRAVARPGVAPPLSADRHPPERQPDDAGRHRGGAPRSAPAQVREWMAAIRDSEDLVSVGAYVPGSNPRIDEARSRRDAHRGASSASRPTRCAGFRTPSTRWRRCE